MTDDNQMRADTWTTINALHLAANKYRDNATVMIVSGQKELADTFNQQAKNCERIAAELQDVLDEGDAA